MSHSKYSEPLPENPAPLPLHFLCSCICLPYEPTEDGLKAVTEC